MNKGRVAAVGYDSGIVRVVVLNDGKISLCHVFKAHDAPVVKVAYAPLMKDMLVTCS